MTQYDMLDRWVRTIAGCYVWRNLMLSMPGGPTPGIRAEVETWMANTLDRIRDASTEF